jgi:D-glycero-alpha-D-manno-heptose-7-phosphate kinase
MYRLPTAGDPQMSAPTAAALYHRDQVNTSTVIRARSPLRISFAGGGTDLPHYYEQFGGAVLSSTISRYAFATLRPRLDDSIQIHLLESGTKAVYKLGQDFAERDGVFDLVKAAIRRMGSHQGFDLELRSDAPRGSGLGGSSAATAAILGTMAEYLGAVLDPYDMAELNYLIERVDLKIAGGKQDQYATTFGGFNLLEFSKERVHVTPLRLSSEVLHDLEDHLLLCYTGKVRPSLGIVETRMSAFEQRDHTILSAMRRLHSMAYAAKEILLRGRLEEFGSLLDEGMKLKRTMSSKISTPYIDDLYDRAKSAGAIGGKLLGAGGGGYLLLLVGERRRYEVRQSLENAGAVITDFSFQDQGLQTWRSRYF